MTCIPVFSFMQKNGVKHEAVSSKTILMGNEGFRLYDPYVVGLASNYDTLSSKRSTKHLYLSPELVHALQDEVSSPHCHPYKSDIWSLGMLLLEVGLS